jgi:hypothetical protein
MLTHSPLVKVSRKHRGQGLLCLAPLSVICLLVTVPTLTYQPKVYNTATDVTGPSIPFRYPLLISYQ